MWMWSVCLGGQYRAVLQVDPVLPGLQAHAAERPAAGAGAPTGPHAGCQLLQKGLPSAPSHALPKVCPEPEQQG